jgi:GNAT superfamily N-acetyltransferase
MKDQPPSPASIRPVEERDYDALKALVAEVLGEFGFSAEVGGVERDLRELDSRYGGVRAGFWVAELAGQVVGSIAVRPKDERTCEIKRLYLRPGQRGTGLGQQLYEHAEAFARQAGYQRIWLDSSRRFYRAHALYRRNGFTLVEHLDNEWEDDVYEKTLD